MISAAIAWTIGNFTPTADSLSESEAEIEVVTNARGGYVVPGLVDIHSDYIETIISPRPTVLMDFAIAMF